MEQVLGLVTNIGELSFIAFCLSKNILLWSDDKALKQQFCVEIYSASELLRRLELML